MLDGNAGPGLKPVSDGSQGKALNLELDRASVQLLAQSVVLVRIGTTAPHDHRVHLLSLRWLRRARPRQPQPCPQFLAGLALRLGSDPAQKLGRVDAERASNSWIRTA